MSAANLEIMIWRWIAVKWIEIIEINLNLMKSYEI